MNLLKNDSMACCYEFTGRDTGKLAQEQVTSQTLLASDCLPAIIGQARSNIRLLFNQRGLHL